jgi:transcription antitermination factor NusG
VRRSDGKFRKSTLVLFPSYVPFICEEPHSELVKKDRISVILPVKIQERFKKELHALYLAQAAGAVIEPVPAEMPYRIGESVEITSGPLSGMTGVVAGARNETSSVILSIDGLGCAKVTVGVGMITPKI